MMDPDLKKELDRIDTHLIELAKANRKRAALVRGIFTGVGSIIGVALAVVAIGWVLNIVGVIPGLREQAREWKQSLDRIQRLR